MLGRLLIRIQKNAALEARLQGFNAILATLAIPVFFIFGWQASVVALVLLSLWTNWTGSVGSWLTARAKLAQANLAEDVVEKVVETTTLEKQEP